MKRIALIAVLATTFTIFSSSATDDAIQPFTYHFPNQNTFPDDISFCIVDLKYDGNTIKVCEFGEGIESKFKGYDLLHGEGKLWSMFWDSLGTFKLPIWLINKRLKQINKKEIALHNLFRHKGLCSSTLKQLESSKFFHKKIRQARKKSGLAHRAALLVLHTLGDRSSVAKLFTAKYPQCLIIGQATTCFVRNKDKTNILFQDDPELLCYRPKFKLYEKQYSPNLARNIINDLDCEIFVIKPTNASRGNGIIMVDKKQLDQTLYLILQDKKALENYHGDPSYSYWRLDHNPLFIVEEFTPSKSITVNNKNYDPTMRVIFMLCNNAGSMDITFFDAYWKLPTHSLEHQGPFTEKHKSHIGTLSPSSALVTHEDFLHVQAHLCNLLPKLYTKMLNYSSNRHD